MNGRNRATFPFTIDSAKDRQPDRRAAKGYSPDPCAERCRHPSSGAVIPPTGDPTNQWRTTSGIYLNVVSFFVRYQLLLQNIAQIGDLTLNFIKHQNY